MIPPCRDAFINHLRVNSQLGSPVQSAHTAAIMFNDHVAAIVARLFGARSPSAIGLTVQPIVVNTIKRVSLDVPRTHVLDEVKRIMPAIINNNASPAIAFKSLVCLVVASVVHAAPYIVKRLAPKSVFGGGGFLKASAATAAAGDELIKAYIAWRTSASALAPCVAPTSVRGDRLNEPEPEGVAWKPERLFFVCHAHNTYFGRSFGECQ